MLHLPAELNLYSKKLERNIPTVAYIQLPTYILSSRHLPASFPSLSLSFLLSSSTFAPLNWSSFLPELLNSALEKSHFRLSNCKTKAFFPPQCCCSLLSRSVYNWLPLPTGKPQSLHSILGTGLLKSFIIITHSLVRQEEFLGSIVCCPQKARCPRPSSSASILKQKKLNWPE